MDNKKQRPKANVDTNYCVACGMCQKHCPLGAITVKNGIYAVVDIDKCVGCRKCEKVCPASVITMKLEDKNE